MTRTDDLLQTVLDDAWLSLDELCRIGDVTPDWVAERVAEGLLGAAGPAPAHWRFDAPTLRRVRCMVRIEQHFDAVPELAALVADLEGEIARLRQRLRRAGIE